jgi:hypothetical protein
MPNTCGRTRFSIDFRTAHGDDLATHGGLPTPDRHCTGTIRSSSWSLLRLITCCCSPGIQDEIMQQQEEPAQIIAE